MCCGVFAVGFVSARRSDKSPSVLAAPTTSAFNLFDCILYGPGFEMRVNGFVGGFVPREKQHECFFNQHNRST